MKYPTLESLRGVAAIMVALFHCGFVNGDKYPVIAQGPIFVDFFFVLSGFVMAFAYQDKIAQGLEFRSFILLRLGRLYPLHLVMLLVWVPYIGAKYYAYHQLGMGPSDPTQDNNLYTFSTNVLLLHSLGFHDDQNWNTVSWSISVEFYTYIVFFLMLSVFRAGFRGWHAWSLAMAAYAALWGLGEGTLLKTYDYGILRAVGGFFLGVGVYTVHQHHQVTWGAVTSSLVEIGVVIVLAIAVIASEGSRLGQLLTFGVFAVTVYVFAAQRAGMISRLLLTSPMLFFGKLSYSVYMVHMLVFTVAAVAAHYVLKMPSVVVERAGADLVRYINTPWADVITIVLMAVVIGLSWFSYRWIEAPWQDAVPPTRDF